MRAIRSNVVKFIVNVRLMLNTLNSHVGNVMVVKVTVHNKNLGVELRRYQTRPTTAVSTAMRLCCSSADCKATEDGVEAFMVARRGPRAEEVTAGIVSGSIVDESRRPWDHDFLQRTHRIGCLTSQQCWKKAGAIDIVHVKFTERVGNVSTPTGGKLAASGALPLW